MTSRILQELAPDKLCQQMALPVLEEVYPRDLVCQVLHDLDRWEQRERKLNHVIIVYLLIAWTLLPTMALKRVWAQLSSALRWLSQQAQWLGLPGGSAWCYRRRTLGVGPLRLLMRLACQPLCQPSTPGAFCFGRRLIAIDSKLFDVCETPENDWTFRGRAAGTTSHAGRVPFRTCVCSRPWKLARMRMWGRCWLLASSRKWLWFQNC